MVTQSASILENTHSRYPGNRDEAYTRSYRVIRLMVGFLGILLPLIFIFVEAYLLKGGLPQPPSCSFVEQQLGEHTTALIHAGCAVAFIVSLAVMSFLFAASEVQSTDGRVMVPGKRWFSSRARRWIYIVCGLIILAAGAWAFWGAGVWQLTPLYIGEVVSVWAFGISWLLAGFFLTAPARHEVPVSDDSPPLPSVTTR